MASNQSIPSPSASRTNLTPTSSKSSGKNKEVDMNSNDDIDMTDTPAPFRLRESVRVSQPDKFDGNRKNLNAFLLQTDLYFSFNKDKFDDDYNSKSLFATYFF